MLYKYQLLLYFLVFHLVSGSLFAQEDWGEPNDTQGEAHTISPTVSLNATIGYGSDADDWYAVTFTENGTYTYRVSNTNTSGIANGRIGDIRLYDASLQGIASINMDYYPMDDYVDPAASSTRQAAVEGGATYYLHINQYSTNHSAPYSLLGSFAASNADVGEPNNASGEAYEITDPASLAATIGLGDDGEDWYQVTFSSNGTFNFTLTNLNGSSVANGGMGTATLYNTSLTEVTNISSSYLQAGENSTSSTVPVEGGQAYYIMVTDYTASNETGAYYHGAPYSLQANPSGTELVDTATPATPQNLSAIAGTGQVTLNWSPNTEQDMANYKVYKDASLPVSTFLASVAFGTETYIDSDVTNDVQYYYSITSIDQVGHESDLSEPVSVIPSVPPSITITSGVTSPTNLSPIPFTVQFSEDVTGFTEEDVVAENSTVFNLTGSSSLYTFDVVPMADGEVSIEVPADVATDWTGMGNTASQPVIFVYDNTPPVVSVSGIEDQGTLSTYNLEWEAEDLSEIVAHHIYFSMDSTNYDEIDQVDGDVFSYAWVVPNVVSDENWLVIESFDELGLSASDTSNVFAIIDDVPPVINLLSPTINHSVPEYHDITTVWSASDNIEMDQVDVYYSNDWGTSFTQMGSTSELTEYTFPIPPGVTEGAQIKLIAKDIYNNQSEAISDFFSVTDNTPPTVDITSPATGDSLSIGSSTLITLNQSDNVGIVNHEFTWSIDESNWTEITPDSNTDSTFHIPIPNQISDNFMIRLIVSDAVGLKDTSVVSGIHVVIEYPRVLSYSGNDELFGLIANANSIQLEFSVAMKFESIMDISIQSAVLGELLYEVEEISGQVFLLNVSQNLASRDTLTLSLPASIQSTYGYGLDGNGDGVPGDIKTINILTETLADYDQNNEIDFDDLTTFVTAWYADDYSRELGPFTGEAPHLIPTFDGDFNIQDIVAFVYMWNWSAGISLSAPLMDQFQYEEFVSEQVGNTLMVSIPSNEHITSQTIIRYDPRLVSISLTDQGLSKVSANGLTLVDVNPDNGFILITNWQLSGSIENQLELTLEPITRQSYSIEVAIQSSDEDANVIQRKSEISVLPIPTASSLSQNYPNPFNNSTTIEYGLPANSELNISIYDTRGCFVKELHAGSQQAGFHSVQWNGLNINGQNLASGLYFIVLKTPDYRVVSKALMLK